jgi:RNA polymerase primary sigma factor
MSIQVSSNTPASRNRSQTWRAPSQGDVADPSVLGLYMREMSAHDLMSPEQEQQAAQEIQRARSELWVALLGYAPFVAAVVEAIELRLPSEPRLTQGLTGDLTRALSEIGVASRKIRDRQTRAHREQFDRAVAALAVELARIDTDNEIADPIVADLRRLAEGERRLHTLHVTLPPVGSLPFARHVARVQRCAASLLAAKNRFVRANLRLVVTMARRFNHGRLPLADLIQEGNMGLLKAVDRFDPARGFRFSTYASWWIRHAIGRGLADKGREVRVPVHMIEVHHRLERVRKTFSSSAGREPTDEELAAQAGVPLGKIERLRHCLMDSGTSLDTPIGSDDVRTLGELLQDESVQEASDLLADRRMEHKVRELLAQLRPIEADVLRKRFGFDADEPLTLREIGDQYSLSRERIRQVQEQALGKIRRELRRQQLI